MHWPRFFDHPVDTRFLWNNWVCVFFCKWFKLYLCFYHSVFVSLSVTDVANLREFFHRQSTDVAESHDLEHIWTVLCLVMLYEWITMKTHQYYDHINNEKNQIYNLKMIHIKHCKCSRCNRCTNTVEYQYSTDENHRVPVLDNLCLSSKIIEYRYSTDENHRVPLLYRRKSSSSRTRWFYSTEEDHRVYPDSMI